MIILGPLLETAWLFSRQVRSIVSDGSEVAHYDRLRIASRTPTLPLRTASRVHTRTAYERALELASWSV